MNKYEAINKEEILILNAIKGQVTEEINSLMQEDASVVEVSHTCCYPGEKARGIMAPEIQTRC